MKPEELRNDRCEENAMNFEERARGIVESMDGEGLVCGQDDCPKCRGSIRQIEDALRAAHEEGRQCGLEDAIKICRDYAFSGKVSVMRRQVVYACITRIREYLEGRR